MSVMYFYQLFETFQEGFECECCIGFFGSHCDEFDACFKLPCKNLGICVDLSQGHEKKDYKCLCPYGFTGEHCEIETRDPCNLSQCLNGATCISNASHFR